MKLEHWLVENIQAGGECGGHVFEDKGLHVIHTCEFCAYYKPCETGTDNAGGYCLRGISSSKYGFEEDYETFGCIYWEKKK